MCQYSIGPGNFSIFQPNSAPEKGGAYYGIQYAFLFPGEPHPAVADAVDLDPHTWRNLGGEPLDDLPHLLPRAVPQVDHDRIRPQRPDFGPYRI